MKLQALSDLDRGIHDLTDARAPARHLAIADLAIADVETLDRFYRSIYSEAPPPEAKARFASVVSGDTP